MKLMEQVVEILHRSGRWMTPREVTGAMRALFGTTASEEDVARILDSSSVAWVRAPEVISSEMNYRINPVGRGDWLVSKFGLGAA